MISDRPAAEVVKQMRRRPSTPSQAFPAAPLKGARHMSLEAAQYGRFIGPDIISGLSPVSTGSSLLSTSTTVASCHALRQPGFSVSRARQRQHRHTQNGKALMAIVAFVALTHTAASSLGDAVAPALDGHGFRFSCSRPSQLALRSAVHSSPLQCRLLLRLIMSRARSASDDCSSGAEATALELSDDRH